MVQHRQADQFLFDYVIGGAQMRQARRPLARLKRKAKPIKRRLRNVLRLLNPTPLDLRRA